MFVQYLSETRLDKQLRHLPAERPGTTFDMTFVCACGEVHALALRGHDAEAALWGEPVPLTCGASLIVKKPLGS